MHPIPKLSKLMNHTPEQLRFILELEFVQALANPQYVQFLAQNNYFTPDFTLYLNYLQYWHKKPYCNYIVYPYCLDMLCLLQNQSFRELIKTNDLVALLHKKEFQGYSDVKPSLVNTPVDEGSMGELVAKVLALEKIVISNL